MFRTKICGITSAEDAELVRRLGGDAIGLNFCAQSARYAGDLDADPPPVRWGGNDVMRVGVFVNAPVDVVRSAIESWSLDAIQFHGDEPPETLVEFDDCRRIKVFRLRPDNLTAIGEFLSRCDALGCLPEAVLIDAWQEDVYGGTGARADWQLLAKHRAVFGSLPLILAGGLDPSNVAEAIVATSPDGVDVASGVERAPGMKDKRMTAAFIKAAKSAFVS